jgi:hypothetical protein
MRPLNVPWWIVPVKQLGQDIVDSVAWLKMRWTSEILRVG